MLFFSSQKFLGALDAEDVFSYFGTSSVSDGMQGSFLHYRTHLSVYF